MTSATFPPFCSDFDVLVNIWLYLKHIIMMTPSNGKIFRVTSPLVGNSSVTGEFPHKSQWRGALMYLWSAPWINSWVNNREAGDLRRNRVHYDVIVMTRAITRSHFSCLISDIDSCARDCLPHHILQLHYHSTFDVLWLPYPQINFIPCWVNQRFIHNVLGFVITWTFSSFL